MSSTIFYRFRSQKDTSRVLFDGTGLTVFDLKREIIQDNRLGDGTDFQLRLYNPDTEEELEDDSTVIPRSSTVVVRRSPAIKSAMQSAAFNASRYVTGRPRVFQRKPGNTASNNPGLEMNSGGNTNAAAAVVDGTTEDERIANMFATQRSQWEQTQEAMSGATPVFGNRNGPGGGADSAPPPPGYMCYRCGGRDHWIKNCPTNNDPHFEGKRIRRTTGIPKKFLRSVEIDPESMSPEELAQNKVMVTDEGKFVIQVADQHSWDDYQRKQQTRLVDAKNAIWEQGHFNDLPEELTCRLTKGLLREPVRTKSCCETLVSRGAMEDALLERDFVCPLCGQEGVLLDSLVEDVEAEKLVQEFLQKHQETEDAGPPDKKPRLDTNMKPLPQLGMPPLPSGVFPMPFMPFIPPFAPTPGVIPSSSTGPSVAVTSTANNLKSNTVVTDSPHSNTKAGLGDTNDVSGNNAAEYDDNGDGDDDMEDYSNGGNGNFDNSGNGSGNGSRRSGRSGRSRSGRSGRSRSGRNRSGRSGKSGKDRR